jgi:hypothetical protein
MRIVRIQNEWPLSVAIGITIIACGERELRGTVSESEDGRTYLIIADDNGGGCAPIRVDGQVWAHALGEPGSIEPGSHRIECGTTLEVDVQQGTVFEFSYWGP